MADGRSQNNKARLDDATVSRIELHYQRLGLGDGWTRERVNRLCKLLNCTSRELGALCCVPHWRLNSWLEKNQIPTYVSLHFALIESAYMAATTGHAGTPIMPIHELQGSGCKLQVSGGAHD